MYYCFKLRIRQITAPLAGGLSVLVPAGYWKERLWRRKTSYSPVNLLFREVLLSLQCAIALALIPKMAWCRLRDQWLQQRAQRASGILPISQVSMPDSEVLGVCLTGIKKTLLLSSWDPRDLTRADCNGKLASSLPWVSAESWHLCHSVWPLFPPSSCYWFAK